MNVCVCVCSRARVRACMLLMYREGMNVYAQGEIVDVHVRPCIIPLFLGTSQTSH